MIVTIPILTAVAFVAIYPLCFWIHFDDSFKAKFRKFNIALPNVIGGLVLILVWVIDIPISIKIVVTVWKACLVSVSSYSWKKEYPNPKLMTIPCLIGIYAFIRLQGHFVISGGTISLIGIFGG